ncbi:hypothetical protein FSP39_021619 [Pinctada imbricata]|uniref:Coiled-coil domain-containing protein 158 n=1 Tax=Pinctada imbricata TaxID=66713 RepID=A0AA88Y9T5_PINIB|nr:hypothetical protein FSP39_021619 [Pinctada imbricata]
MAAGGTPFIPNSLGPPMNVNSPLKGIKPVSSGTKRSSSMELIEQIKQLEIEGQKLRNSNLANLGVSSFSGIDSTADFSINPSSQFSPINKAAITPTSPTTLSSLIDISNEQKTIADLRVQLDAQRKETDRLQHQLLGDQFGQSRVPNVVNSGLPSSPSKTGFSTLPSTELFSARRPQYDYGPPSHLEKALKDSQEQVADLRRRLQEASEVCEQQKRQFRASNEELKAKLQETAGNRDALLELRSKEGKGHEELVNKLQYTVQQLQEKIKAQEMALKDANRKGESSSREKYLSDTTLNQVRAVLTDVEKKRGRPFFDSDPVDRQVPGMLVHTLERCVQEFTTDNNQKKCKIEELEGEIKSLKQNLSQDKETLFKEQQDKITNMAHEHERQMLTMQEKANNSRKQATQLQQQLALIEGQNDQQLKMKDDNIRELESKIKHLKDEYQEDRIKWQEKKDSYERSLEDLQKEMIKLRTDRDEAVKNHTISQNKVEELQSSATKLKVELDVEKQKNTQLWEKEMTFKSREKELENKLDDVKKDNVRLEKMLELIKSECNAQVSEKISSAERQERERHLDQISSLTSQLSSLTEKSNRLSLDLELTRTENTNYKQQIRELNEKADSLRIQLDSVSAEKKHASNMLSDKVSDMERVVQERDYYSTLLDQRNEELAVLKSQKEKLTIQIEEKDKNVQVLTQQSNNFTSVIETSSREKESLKEEKDKLMHMLNERTSALEELRASRETLSKKMKIREKRVKELEEEKQKTAAEIQIRHEEMNILQQEKDSLYKELKESRYEVATLNEERDSVKAEYDKEIVHNSKEISKLQAKNKAMEQEVRLAQKALKSRESADHQAVKVADKMQKEVTLKRGEIDSMKTKIRWLEDKVDSLSRERNSLEGDKDRLKTSLNKSLTHNQQLSAELELSQSRVLELKSQLNRLEIALEKCATKNATAQAELEQYQQEVARLKLRHQLDLQEALQNRGPLGSTRVLDDEEMKSSYKPTYRSLTPVNGLQSLPVDNSLASSLPTRDTDDYKYVGSELKNLLNEMKSLMADKKQKQAHKASHHRRSRTQEHRPISSYSSSETEYHSDVELERSMLRSRQRGRTANVDDPMLGPDRGSRSRSMSPSRSHRRSHSNDTSQLLQAGEYSYASRGISDITQNSPVKDSTYGTESYTSNQNRTDETDITANTQSNHESQSSNSDYTGEDVRGSSGPPVTDTQDLCKRLEEKIQSLTKMGGTLQKENREMADLMKMQGKKIKKVKESTRKVKKTVR